MIFSNSMKIVHFHQSFWHDTYNLGARNTVGSSSFFDPLVEYIAPSNEDRCTQNYMYIYFHRDGQSVEDQLGDSV